VKYVPRPHQQIGTQALLNNLRFMLVADPGMGKTAMVLMALCLLLMVGSTYFPALVIAPKRVAEVVWDGERDKWEDFQHLRIVKILGSREERLAALRAPKADIYVINYENIGWLIEQFTQETWPFKIVIADECSKLKGFRLNQGTKRASALSKIARFTGRWWNLTGSPIPNGLQDLWGQAWFIDFGASLKRSYTAFLEAYFIENVYTHKITPQHGAEAAIHEAAKPWMLALRAKDWLDITEPQEIPVEVNMPEAAREQYKQMERQFFLQIDDASIEAGTAAIKSTKLLEMASGSVYDDNDIERAVHDAKIEGLADILEQIAPEPLLVAYYWRFDVPRILKAFPQARVYSGKQDERDWNAGKVPMMLLHMQSPYGLNLHGPCHDICFYSYRWDAEAWTQMLNRVGATRQAQIESKRIVRVWSIRSRGTIDADVIDSNFKKLTVEEALKRARAQRYV
jgi:SNF2 family DNA or RNA helicase